MHCANDITRKLKRRSHSIPKESSKKSDILKGKRTDTLSIASYQWYTIEDLAVVISRNSRSSSDRRPSHHEFIDRDEAAEREAGWWGGA